jgi:dihydroorotase
MVDTGLLDWAGVADRMSVRPAAIGRVTGHGGVVEAGRPANLTLVDPQAEWTVEPTALASRSRNTPFAGRTLPTQVIATVLRGRLTVADGALREPVSA